MSGLTMRKGAGQATLDGTRVLSQTTIFYQADSVTIDRIFFVMCIEYILVYLLSSLLSRRSAIPLSSIVKYSNRNMIEQYYWVCIYSNHNSVLHVQEFALMCSPVEYKVSSH